MTKHAELSTDTRVNISSPAYLKMIYHAYQFANPLIDKDTWVEAMGWLSGSLTTDNERRQIININQSWPISHGDAVSVSIENYGGVLTTILEEIEKSTTKETQSILGWYHTHPGYGLFMSQVDFETQTSYQKLFDKAVAIVLDQTMLSSIHYGFKIFRLQQDLQTFERIPFKMEKSFKRGHMPRILNFYIEKIKNQVTLSEYDR